VAILDNPAGRLHAILAQYRAVAAENRSIHSTWIEVLGVEPQRDLPVVLAKVASLVPSIQAAVSRGGSAEQAELVAHFAPLWAEAVIPIQHQPTQKPSRGKDMVDQGSLATLAGLSAYLSATQSEGVVPDDDSVAELRAHVQEAIDALAAAADIPSDIRRLILDRLHDVLWALDSIRIGGPGAVVAAAERLVVSLVLSEEARQSPAGEKAKAAVFKVWQAFVTLPAIRNSIEVLTQAAAALPPGLGG
jgi:hypothetical protein